MEETNRKSWVALLVEVLTSPGAAFKEIVENPRFGAAAVTLTVINLVFAVFTIPKVRELALLTLENTPGLSPEEIEAASAFTGGLAVGGTVFAAIAVPWVIWLVMATLMKIFAAISAKEAPFGSLFAVGVYGYVPALFGCILNSILTMVTPVENLAKVSISLAVFSPVESGFLYYFLTACNPFIWWSLILWGIGGAAVMKNKRTTGVLIYLFGLWLIFALISGALGNTVTALSGM
jgi:hypothetical protein